jgi:hypothetical protein
MGASMCNWRDAALLIKRLGKEDADHNPELPIAKEDNER